MMSVKRMITRFGAPEVAGDRAEEQPEREADADGDDADQQREPRAVDHARELVASEVVDPERVLHEGPGQQPRADEEEVLLARVVRREQRARRSRRRRRSR